MGQKGGLAAILAAVVAAAMRMGPVSSIPRIVDRYAVSVSQAVEGGPESALLNTFSEFDKSADIKPPFADDGSCSAGMNNASRLSDWFIATVPDPERSNLKLDFDRDLEAIQSAAATAGYQFERFWFPWSSEESASDGGQLKTGEATAPSLREKTARHQRRSERQDFPGVLLFRRSVVPSSPELPDVLAIFLVGETPTTGINPEQFRYASCLGKSLHQPNYSRGLLRIIGPGYSGSFDSLARLAEPSDKLVIRSWTADLFSQQQFLDTVAKPAQGGKAVPGKVDLKTTRIPSIVSINSFVEYLRNVWHDPSPVVLLKEEGTGLASGIVGCDGRKGSPSLTCIDDKKVFFVEFPRNLSTLRNATESEASVSSPVNSKTSELPRNGLLFSLKGPEHASYEIPRFSNQQTPVSQEAVLFSIASLLKTGSVHYAGIIASDSLDELFLSRFLRSACPNLRLFTLNSDLLSEHGSDSSDYEGMLAVSTYPLFPMSEIWAGSGRDLHVFPSQNFEAAYNAVLDSLASVADPAEERSSILKPDFRNPFEAHLNGASHLAAWLTVAGRSGFEPISILNAPAAPLTLHAEGGAPKLVPEYWEGWGYCFIAVLSPCLLFMSLLAAASPEGKRRLTIFSVKAREPGAATRAFYLSVVALCLAVLISAWLAVPGQITFQNLFENPALPSLKMFAFVTFCSGSISAVLLFVATARHRRGVDRERHGDENDTTLHPQSQAAAATAHCSLAALAIFEFMSFRNPFPPPASAVLAHLWILFCCGSFVLGAILTASAAPIWDLAYEGRTRVARPWSANRTKSSRLKLGWDLAVLVGLLISAIAYAYIAYLWPGWSDPVHFLAACRALNLTSGVSPLVPLTLLAGVVVMLVSIQLQRVVYYEDRCPAVPDLRRDLFCPKIRRTTAEIRRRCRRITLHPVHFIAFAAMLICLYRIWASQGQQTFERSQLESLMVYGSVATAFLLVLIWIRLLLIWSAFSEFLQQLERHPLRNVFSLLPRGFVWSPVWQGGGKKRTHVVVTRSLECILALRQHEHTSQMLKDVIDSRMESLRKQVRELLCISASRRRTPRKMYRELERNLSAIATAAAHELEEKKWPHGSYELKAELSTREETRDALHVSNTDFKEEEPETICGELIAFRFLAFINFVLWQIDNLAGFLSVGFLLLAVALNSYDFRSRTIIGWLLVLLFTLLTSGIVTVFAQTDRDAILSRITGTQEGKLDRHFFTHLISYGAMPGLVLIGTHFPTIGKFLFSWVKPALEAIH